MLGVCVLCLCLLRFVVCSCLVGVDFVCLFVCLFVGVFVCLFVCFSMWECWGCCLSVGFSSLHQTKMKSWRIFFFFFCKIEFLVDSSKAPESSSFLAKVQLICKNAYIYYSKLGVSVFQFYCPFSQNFNIM